MATPAHDPATEGKAQDRGHEGHSDGAHGGTMRDYVTGFLLSAVLTAIPFWLIMGDVFRQPSTAAIVVMAFAVAQIFVHMVYFLHMNPRSEGGWTMLAMIFTVVLVVITLSGSYWVMLHLNSNMMPGSHEMTTGEPMRMPSGETMGGPREPGDAR